MILRDPKGKPVRPTYSNGGTWLKHVNDENALCAHFTHAITNHAPVGEYYQRFNIPDHKTHECECGCPMQTQHHIFTQCGILDTQDSNPQYVVELVGFLIDNPKVFAFGFQYVPRGGG